MTDYTRRDKKKLAPEVLGRYHALVMQADVSGLEKLLALYAPHIPEDKKRELIEDFRRVAENAVRRRWLHPERR